MFTVNRKRLREALAHAKRCGCAKRSSMPILESVRFADGGHLVELTATDLELAYHGAIEPELSGTPFEPFCLSHRVLSAFVRKAKGESVTFTPFEATETSPSTVRLVSGASTLILATTPGDEYPSLAELEGAEPFESITAATFAAALARVIPAMSTDDTRYNLCAVYIEHLEPPKHGRVRFVATDGHRLHTAELGAFHWPEPALLPRGYVIALEAAARKAPGSVSFTRDGFRLTAELGSDRFTCRLIEGEFPDYRHVIPERNGKAVLVSVPELTEALESVVIMAPERSQAVKVSVDVDRLRLEASNPDCGSASREVPANVSAFVDELVGMELALNGRYFADALSVCGVGSVSLGFDDSLKPVRFDADGEDGVAIVMPMRL